jgi:HmuY protein
MISGRARVVVVVAAMVIIAATLVGLSVRRPSVPMFAPTRAAPRDIGRARVGPILYTVDATSPERWRHFSFRLGSVIDDAGPLDWDLGFRRFQIIANGGPRFTGRGGVVDLGDVVFADVASAPESGYVQTEGGGEPRNAALAGWYRYGFFSHMLTPRRRVWAVRAADGRYAKMEIVSYYCPDFQPGCLTFRYVFQGDGSRRLEGS